MKTLLIEYKNPEIHYFEESDDLFKSEKNNWPFGNRFRKTFNTFYKAHGMLVDKYIYTDVPEDLDINTAWFKDMVVQMLPPTATDITVSVQSKSETGRSTTKPVTINDK